MIRDERFQDQVPAIGEEGQARLGRVVVHQQGCGRLGTSFIFGLVQAGVRTFVVNDPQSVTKDSLGFFFHACPNDVGMPKVRVLERFFSRYPDIAFRGLALPNEAAEVRQQARRADLLCCAANKLSGRKAGTRNARDAEKPVLDIGVSDGRETLGGSVKLWLPGNRDWSACPCCYFEPGMRVPRGEGLLSTVITYTAAVAAQLAVQLLLGLQDEVVREHNLFVIDAARHHIDKYAVVQRPGCAVCGAEAQSRQEG